AVGLVELLRVLLGIPGRVPHVGGVDAVVLLDQLELLVAAGAVALLVAPALARRADVLVLERRRVAALEDDVAVAAPAGRRGVDPAEPQLLALELAEQQLDGELA